MSTANSVMRLPYQLKDGSHILSEHGTRVGSQVETAELRITVGGWVSQTLLHTADPTRIIDDDIVPYIRDKGFKPSELGPIKLVESLKKSQPLIAQYVPRGLTWTLIPRVNPAVYDIDKLVDAVWAAAANPNSGSFSMGRGNGGSMVDWGSSGRLPVLVWPEAEAQRSYFDQANNVISFGKLDGDARSRTVDPLGWFQRLLRDCGFRESEMHFAGYIDGNDRTVTPGITEVRGPMDIHGRCPRFQYPAYDNRFGLIVPFDVTCSKNPTVDFSSVGFSVRGKGWSFGSDFNTIATSVGYRPVPSVMIKGLGWWNADGGDIVAPKATFDERVKVKANVRLPFIPLGETFIDGLVASTGGIFDSATSFEVVHSGDPVRKSSLNCLMVSNKWRIARPLTLLDFKIPQPVITVVRNKPDEMKVLELRSPVMGVTMPFEALRDAARAEIGRNGTDVDRVGLQKFLKDSESYADAMVFTSFYASEFTPVTMRDIENIEIVRKGEKADKKILDEEVDGKQTLRQLAKRVDADQKKGVKYSAFSNVVDELASVEELVTPYVGDRLRYASGFVLTSSVDPAGGYVSIMGQFGDESPVVLAPLEASLLRAHGAVDNVPVAAWETLGVSDVSTEDLLSYGKSFEKGSNGALTWDFPIPRKWDVLTPREFCSGDGYPVANYSDRDSYARMLLLFKGTNGDVSNMVGATLFLNTLGLES